MATQVKFRGGTTTEHSTFVGSDREMTVDTTKETLVVHDGSTAGGFPLARASSSESFTCGALIATTLTGNGSAITNLPVDPDNYVNSASWNTSTGVLTLTRTGSLADITATIPTEIPSQSGNTGKHLTTDGTTVSWSTIPTEIPSQSGNTGKHLTTDGSAVSWVTIPTEIPSQSGNNGKYLTTDGSAVSWVTIGAGGNDYVDSIAFSTSTGVLTVGRTGSLADLTVDLDGKYSESGHNHSGVYSTTGHTHSDVTTSVAGFMSTADKTKLDGVATSANNYSHPSVNHIPTGGAADQFLKYSSSGAAIWAQQAGVTPTSIVSFTSGSGTYSPPTGTKVWLAFFSGGGGGGGGGTVGGAGTGGDGAHGGLSWTGNETSPMAGIVYSVGTGGLGGVITGTVGAAGSSGVSTTVVDPSGVTQIAGGGGGGSISFHQAIGASGLSGNNGHISLGGGGAGGMGGGNNVSTAFAGGDGSDGRLTILFFS